MPDPSLISPVSSEMYSHVACVDRSIVGATIRRAHHSGMGGAGD